MSEYLCDRGSTVELLDLPKEHLELIKVVLDMNKLIIDKLCNPPVVVTGDVGMPYGE